MLLAVDEEAELGPVERELRDRYSRDYGVVCTHRPEEALATLESLAAEGEEVALVLASQWLRGTTGSELLARVRQLHPHAKRGLLIPWGGWGHRPTGQAVADSMARGNIDYYVLRPSGCPDEVFHNAVTGFLLEWAQARGRAPHTVHVVGEDWSGRAYELRDVLAACALPHAFALADSPEGRELLDRWVGGDARFPFVCFPDGTVLFDPTNADLARASGSTVDPVGSEFDLVIVGAGPTGLSAAVYGASEGFDVLVVDKGGIGGQATSSSLIRNYLGFPRGVSGGRLAARAYEQAWVFGANFAFMQSASSLRRDGERLLLTLADFGDVAARAVLLATGASYRRLGVPELEDLNGAGVFYGGPASGAPSVGGLDVYVLGGANSAGQAALHLARYARQVTLVVRAGSLEAGMSHYLARAIEGTSNLRVRLGAEIVGGGGEGWLERLVLRDGATGAEETVPADGLFVMIGARPRTDWLPDEIRRDARGFLLTGADLAAGTGDGRKRPALPLETSMPAVFAAGDVRHGSVKRVASAVGEGSVAIQQLHGLFAAERLAGRSVPRLAAER